MPCSSVPGSSDATLSCSPSLFLAVFCLISWLSSFLSSSENQLPGTHQALTIKLSRSGQSPSLLPLHKSDLCFVLPVNIIALFLASRLHICGRPGPCPLVYLRLPSGSSSSLLSVSCISFSSPLSLGAGPRCACGNNALCYQGSWL